MRSQNSVGGLKLQFVGLLVLGAGWWLLSSDLLGILPSTAVASPQQTFPRAIELLKDVEFWSDILSTSGRALIGVIIALVIGFPLGVTLGASRAISDLSIFPVDFLRSIPVTALYPAFVLLFGLGSKPVTAMVITACVFPILVNTLQAARSGEVIRQEISKVFGARTYQTFLHVTCYEVVPFAIAGTKLALSIGMIVVVLAEMFLGLNNGIGQRLWDAYSLNDVRTVTFIVLVIGSLGFVLNRIFEGLARHVFRWVDV